MTSIDFTASADFTTLNQSTAVEEQIKPHLPALVDQIDELDKSGLLSSMSYGSTYEALVVDEDDAASDAAMLEKALTQAIKTLVPSLAWANAYAIPGSTNMFYVLDDEIVDPYHLEVILLLQASEVVPEFGKALGLLGLGIKL